MMSRFKDMPLDRLMEDNKATAILQSASAELFQENENLRREVEQFRGKGFMSTTMVPTTTAQKRPATEDLQEQNKRQQHAGVPDETLMKIRQNLAWYQEQEKASSSKGFLWGRPPQAFGARFEPQQPQQPATSSPAQAAVQNNAAAAQ